MILRNLLFFTAILLIIGWVLVVFVWPHDGYWFHILLVLAILALVFAVTLKPEKENDE